MKKLLFIGLIALSLLLKNTPAHAFCFFGWEDSCDEGGVATNKDKASQPPKHYYWSQQELDAQAKQACTQALNLNYEDPNACPAAVNECFNKYRQCLYSKCSEEKNVTDGPYYTCFQYEIDACDAENFDTPVSSACSMDGGQQGSQPDTGQWPSSCGDKVVSGAEECDDGNTNENDGCDNTCHKKLIVFQFLPVDYGQAPQNPPPPPPPPPPAKEQTQEDPSKGPQVLGDEDGSSGTEGAGCSMVMGQNFQWMNFGLYLGLGLIPLVSRKLRGVLRNK